MQYGFQRYNFRLVIFDHHIVLKMFRIFSDPTVPTTLVRNTLVQTIPTLYPHWTVSFELRPTGKVKGWSNIFHMTIGKNIGSYGDRTPGIWFFDNTTFLYIASAKNGNEDCGARWWLTDTPTIQLNQWTRIDAVF